MARKTFISYKYSESRDLRDRILDALREDAIYYQGETSDSPDMSDSKTETIKNLKNMIYGSSVTIVIVSPNMRKSKWIDWEISYSLKRGKERRPDFSYKWRSLCDKKILEPRVTVIGLSHF